MRTKLAIATLIGLTSLMTRAEELKKLSLDDTSTVSPKIEIDPTVRVEGKGSLKITTKWPTTVCLGEVSGPDVENAKLVYAARVKSELDGAAFLEMWAHFGSQQYFSRGMNDPVEDTSDWKSIQTPFVFQKAQKPDKVTLNLIIDGIGTIWIDDIVLFREPLE